MAGDSDHLQLSFQKVLTFQLDEIVVTKRFPFDRQNDVLKQL